MASAKSYNNDIKLKVNIFETAALVMATILDPDLFYNHISHLVEKKHKFDGGGSSISVHNVISFTRVNLLTNLSRLYMVITAKNVFAEQWVFI